MMKPADKIRVLICDDHPMMIAGIRDCLLACSDIEIVGTASSSEEAISRARELRPDVVLMDIAMPDFSGIEATRKITSELDGTEVIILTMHEDDEYLAQFVDSGAKGYILKRNPPDELVVAIRSAHRGHAFFSPRVCDHFLKERKKVGRENAHKTELTPREREVLIFLAKGFTSKEIGLKLCISPRTVGKDRELIMAKLDLHSVAELTQYAIAKKLIGS